MNPTYSGEVQFAGYSDSSRSGPRITLRLAERADLESFVGSEGKRYMLALVEIGADEQPVQPQSKPAGPLCKWVAIRCKEQSFINFLRPVYDKALGGSGNGWGDVSPEHDFEGNVEKWAAHAVRFFCEVESRADIDGNDIAEERLHRIIRQPYADWLAARGGK